MIAGSSAIVTVAFGHSTENLDHTFLSFARKNPGVPLHAFIIGNKLPERRLSEITYHLITPVPDFSHPLREVYFRRHELISALEVEFALIVDSYDVLCLQPLPAFDKVLAGFDMAAATEHMGSRFILGQGYTSNFLNGGVTWWNVPKSADIRAEIGARGRKHFRTVADDQFVINEVVQTKYFDRVRILPSQYNFRPHYLQKHRGWPAVESLDGVVIYHNATCMNEAKKAAGSVKARASLPPLPADGRPLTEREQFWRRLRQRLGLARRSVR